MTPASPLEGVRLVALDLDGTLLPASKKLTDRTIGVVRDVRAAGIEVTLATGKGWNHTRRYAEELGLTAPVVALEGALVAEPGAAGPAIHSRTLATETVRAVHSALAGLDVGFFYCHDRHRTRLDRRIERWLPQVEIWDPHVDVVAGPPGGEDGHRPFGFTLIGPPAEVHAAKARVAAMALPEVDLFHAEFWDGHDQLHLRPAGVDKRSGLSHVLARLDMGASELLAAGDWWNDVTMLRMARVAVAPSNAVSGARDAAHHVLPRTCEEDALAHFLAEALAGL
jgi:5-amino-6-(5-phospho-D-ribitylamino)uracil phosphatase